MNDFIKVRIFVEGQSELSFITNVVRPHLLTKNIFADPILVSKKGEKGGDVKFTRLQNDIHRALCDKSVHLVSTFVDYYGLKEWPGKDDLPKNATPAQIEKKLSSMAFDKICLEYDRLNPKNRFLPYVVVHEFEALLFSNAQILATELGVDCFIIEDVLRQSSGGPESINNSPETAPSKRLMKWNPRYHKVTMGTSIAKKIGLETIRFQCPLFDQWLTSIENYSISNS